MRVGPISVEKRLYVESMKLLTQQWDIGPLRCHRLCCRKLPAEVREAKAKSAPSVVNGYPVIKMWQYASGARRCRSNSCRPGDPFGCGMNNARLRWRRSTSIIGGWIAGGNAAYLGLLEATGAPGLSLEIVLRAAQRAMTGALGGGGWRAAKRRSGIVGQITTLGVTRSRAGSWIVRRWVLLGGERELSPAEVELLGQSLAGGWERSLTADDEAVSSRHSSLRRVGAPEVSAVARFITGCKSDLDTPEEEDEKTFAESLDIEFSFDKSEESLPDLAKRYRACEEVLLPKFRSAEKREPVVMRGEDFYFQIKRGISRSFRHLTIPEQGRDFMEYAVVMNDVEMWAAYLVRGSDSASQRWNTLIAQARMLKSAYIEVPISERGRYLEARK